MHEIKNFVLKQTIIKNYTCMFKWGFKMHQIFRIKFFAQTIAFKITWAGTVLLNNLKIDFRAL